MSPATGALLALVSKNGEGYDPPGLESFQFGSFVEFTIFGVEFDINKIVTMMLFAVLVIAAFFFFAFRKPQLVPGKMQAAGEAVYDFVRNSIARDVIGAEGVKYAPYLTVLFCYVLLLNFYEILPVAQVPVNSHIAFPIMLSAVTFVLFNYVGIRRKGFRAYFGGIAFPPGVPKVLYLLLTPIELVSTFIVRPFTLAVRLFANMFAGHILLLVFISATTYLLTVGNYSVIFSPISFVMSVVLTIFEMLIIALQAYIFTILTAQYVSGALAEEH